MPSLGLGGFSLVRSWPETGYSGKGRVGALVRLNLTGQGGTTNTIPARVLGFSRIESCGNLLDAVNNRIFPAVPNKDGSAILLCNLAQATDSNRPNAADITTSEAYIEVHGVMY